MQLTLRLQGTSSPDAPDCFMRSMSACASVWLPAASTNCALFRSEATIVAQSAASDLRMMHCYLHSSTTTAHTNAKNLRCSSRLA